MIAEIQKIIKDVQKGKIAPIYLLDGEENFFLDQLADFFEQHLIPAHEKDFNQSIFYGKDSDWKDIINACRRFPMFADRQLVMLKDAAQLKGLNELVAYVQMPMPSTVLVIHHRDKKIDGRGALLKHIKNKGIHFHATKIKDEQVPQWIYEYGQQIDTPINHQAAQLLASFLGNDLQKVVNEIEKVKINIPPGQEISPELIQKFIGVSKEFNLFELPETFVSGNVEKFSRMMVYFIANPKKAPTPLFVKIFYDIFNQLYLLHYSGHLSEKDLASLLKTWPSRLRTLRQIGKQWPLSHIEAALLIVNRYAAAGVGVQHYAQDKELLKEMMGQLYAIAPNALMQKA